MNSNYLPITLVLLLTLTQPPQALGGGIALGQTRVIFSEKEKSQSVTISNSGEHAYLIQARVLMTPQGGESTPFIATPPLSLLKGGNRQLLRILRQDTLLPTDRESLFYLVITAIPAQERPIVTSNKVSVGVQFVIKLFYRPEGLTHSAEESACKLVFRQVADGLHIENPTAYFQTLSKVTVNGKAVTLSDIPLMVEPHAYITIPSSEPMLSANWQTVTDYGGMSIPCNKSFNHHFSGS